MLGTLLAADAAGRHRVVVIGHISTKMRAIAAGVPENCIEHVHACGPLDPLAWRAVGRRGGTLGPAHVYAWGFWGLVAATMVRHRLAAPRSAIFTNILTPAQRRWLPLLARRYPWRYLATSPAIAADLASALTPSPSPGSCPVARTLAWCCPCAKSPAAAPDIQHVPLGIATTRPVTQDAASVRQALGIEERDGPIILLGGEMTEAAARQTYGLWAAAIVQQIFPATRVLVHTGLPVPFNWQQEVRSVRQLAATAPDPRFIMYSAPEAPWRDLLQVAGVLVVTPAAPISIRSLVWAMAAGVPIIATPTPQMQALLEHERTGLLAASHKPRAVAAELEKLFSHPELAPRLAAAARQYAQSAFAVRAMVERCGAAAPCR